MQNQSIKLCLTMLIFMYYIILYYIILIIEVQNQYQDKCKIQAKAKRRLHKAEPMLGAWTKLHFFCTIFVLLLITAWFSVTVILPSKNDNNVRGNDVA